MWQTRTTFISTYIPTPCLYIQYRKIIKRQTQTALEKRFILLIKFSYRKGDYWMLILTKDIVMIVIKIIINIQNKRKMAKVKTLFFQKIKITMQYYTKPSIIQIKKNVRERSYYTILRYFRNKRIHLKIKINDWLHL